MATPKISFIPTRTVRAHCEVCEQRFRRAYSDETVDPVWNDAARHALSTGHEVTFTVVERAHISREGVAHGQAVPVHDTDVTTPERWLGKPIGAL